MAKRASVDIRNKTGRSKKTKKRLEIKNVKRRITHNLGRKSH
ncbi:MAG TPA: hypothetical protein VFA52_02525 [Candidatus Paceibacterota bacterium]|nr:hypothetical protein [Candidatus Paceibacterota bacterium]